MNQHATAVSRSPVRIIGLAGSLREKSYTRHAVEIVLEGARAAGANAELLDLRQLHLPFCTGSASIGESFPDVVRLRREVQVADGFVLGTPEYHGSFSGLLKNALDLTELEDWRGKVIGLVGISGGSAGPGSALVGLRTVGRGLAAWVLPGQVSIASAHKSFDERGRIQSDDLVKRLTDLGRELTRFTLLHAQDRSEKGSSGNVV